MQCAICGITINTVDELIEQDWVHSFFEGEEEHGPVCPSCSETLICIAPDGEFELKEEYKGKIVYQDKAIQYEEDPMTDVVLGFILN
jgi:hypothetical protein